MNRFKCNCRFKAFILTVPPVRWPAPPHPDEC
jgi:hypothetical protein